MDVIDEWRALRAVLQEVAPATAGSIRPPASEAALSAAEATTGLVWPAEIRGLYSICDGQQDGDYGFPGTIFPRSPMYPLSAVVSEHATMTEIGREIVNSEVEYYEGDYASLIQRATEAASVVKVFLPSYLPFAGENGDFYYCDTRGGGARGCIRLFDSESADTDARVFPSLGDFLHDVANAVRSASPLGPWMPTIEDGELFWI